MATNFYQSTLSPTAAMSFISAANLHDLCLLCIFRHVPLVDKIRNLSRVCRNWKRLQRVSLAEPHSLLLLGNNYQHLDIDSLVTRANPTNLGNDYRAEGDDENDTLSPVPPEILAAISQWPRNGHFHHSTPTANTLRMFCDDLDHSDTPPAADYIRRRFFTGLLATLPNVTALAVIDTEPDIDVSPRSGNRLLMHQLDRALRRWAHSGTLRSVRIVYLPKGVLFRNETWMFPRVLRTVFESLMLPASSSAASSKPPSCEVILSRLVASSGEGPIEQMQWLCVDTFQGQDQPRESKSNWLLGTAEMHRIKGFRGSLPYFMVTGSFVAESQPKPLQLPSTNTEVGESIAESSHHDHHHHHRSAATLPDLCLLAIFGWLPLTDRICTVPLVCHNWARVGRAALLTTRTLVLRSPTFCPTSLSELINTANGRLVTPAAFEMERNNGAVDLRPPIRTHESIHRCSLRLPVTDRHEWPPAHGSLWFTDSLVLSLPTVTDLVVVDVVKQDNVSADKRVDHLRQIVRLLSVWGPRGLRRLQLHLFDQVGEMSSKFAQLWFESIRQLLATLYQTRSTLRSLHLNRSAVEMLFTLGESGSKEFPAVLSHLRWFSFEFSGPWKVNRWLFDSIHRLPADHPLQMALLPSCSTNILSSSIFFMFSTDFGQPYHRLAARVAVLQLNLQVSGVDKERKLGRLLNAADHQSLVSLRLGPQVDVSLAAMFRCLAKLPALAELSIHLGSTVKWNSINLHLFEVTELTGLASLPLVRWFSLRTWPNINRKYRQDEIGGHVAKAWLYRALARALPGVRLLCLEELVVSCDDCRLTAEDVRRPVFADDRPVLEHYTPEQMDKIERCLLAAWLPFRECFGQRCIDFHGRLVISEPYECLRRFDSL